ncbi:MAG: outer membrane lipoprotein-sorting protein [Proteobacteria bacterium]|nr:outer membrane lipoprotein-sorting protein [Pseudomonadota bacterium]NDC23284.1 outer membrane lipoprotein-sorting protein [Pseudomonadota bacterium]NDD04414.1 outer membrane lipoprotein-sorting protein [Pseudomonadota bacterium]NDG26176.1 outer membrane lipoprotein-sorting protein [Pseudomonadota bacterium]
MNKLLSFLVVGTSFILSCFAFPSQAALSAKEVVSLGEKQMRGSSSQSTMRMVIKRPSYERELVLRSWALGPEKAVVEILKPAKEEGVVSLRVDQNMWNYLPKTDQVVRVPSSLMLQSWMGSDFTNDDLMKASSLSRDYSHKMLKTESVRGEKSVLIECLPLPQAPVVWGKVLHWARTEDHLPVRQEFYDDKGKLVRTISFSQFKQMDDRVIPTNLRIEKADNSQESTTVTYDKIIFDRDIPDSTFAKDRIKDISQKGKVVSNGWYSDKIN